ncbi:DUF1971 domain-containing protein [Enterovirga rhinocerotis]|uniref:Tellurite resistance-related uncharacterized protein n=1 Tax=Enterovirga rhinocerotis TaxID=1339210 RepID=A0A4R7BTA6_9HYPH|nr:DUF1971 domain-containing protein [Enterovirga rhinocerotis]TDR88984.1 tellurite resistance-related uncharacterized protein [Enterovirga rhinocerotis]
MTAPPPDDERWPAGLKAYKRTPDFTEATIPAGLRREHSTKPGVWAKLHVTDGAIDFHDSSSGDVRRLSAGSHPVIFPERVHHLAVIGPVSLFVEFYSEET